MIAGSRVRRVLMLAVFAAALAAAAVSTPAAQVPATSTFAAEIAALSEPGGYFDTDNLISNERSYLHVIPDLAAAKVRGGAYIGVGPDQNFSYLAHVRPAVAFMLDIRRDNLLLHLLFKTLFGMSRTRVEYLALLLGRPAPDPIAGWEGRPIERIVSYLDGTRPLAPAAVAALRDRVDERLSALGLPLSAADRQTIASFHQQFIAAGLSLQFHSAGRAPQFDYPTYRDLILEVDRGGQRRSFLASEADFQFVKGLQDRDLVIPVVGNLAGPSALAAIGKAIVKRGERLSAFYSSNVEFYLFRDNSFGRFIANLSKVPRADKAVVIRSVFSGGTRVPGYNSASLIQPIGALVDGFARGQFGQYWQLTGRAAEAAGRREDRLNRPATSARSSPRAATLAAGAEPRHARYRDPDSSRSAADDRCGSTGAATGFRRDEARRPDGRAAAAHATAGS